MSVDYRLLARFQASCERHERARRALAERWRADPRPQVQQANDVWVGAVARAREQQDRLNDVRSHPLVWPSEDR